MNVTITIDGHEAIPVRAIPFITGGEMPPSQVASVLAHSDFHFQTIKGEPIKLTAYHLEDGKPHPILPKEWDNVISNLSAKSSNLVAGAWGDAARIAKPRPVRNIEPVPDMALSELLELSPEEIERHLLNTCDDDPNAHIRHKAHELTRAEWERDAVELLPAGVFVWRHEFEQAFRQVYGCLLIVEERQGDRELNYSPLIQEDLRDAVMAGFDGGYQPFPPEEYELARLLGQFERLLRHRGDSRRRTGVHGADVLASVASMLKQVITTNEQAPSAQAIRFRDDLKALADERRRNPSQQNEADVLDGVYRDFMEKVMARPVRDGMATPVYYAETAAENATPDTGMNKATDGKGKVAAIVKRHAELKRKRVKGYTAQTAKEFSVSTRYVSGCSKKEAAKPPSSASQMAEQLSESKMRKIGK